MPEAPPSGVGMVATTRPVSWVDLLNSIAGDLVQVPAVEGGARMRGDIERAHRFPARRVDRVQRVAGRDPDIGAVISDPSHIRDIRKGAVFADDFCC